MSWRRHGQLPPFLPRAEDQPAMAPSPMRGEPAAWQHWWQPDDIVPAPPQPRAKRGPKKKFSSAPPQSPYPIPVFVPPTERHYIHDRDPRGSGGSSNTNSTIVILILAGVIVLLVLVVLVVLCLWFSSSRQRSSNPDPSPHDPWMWWWYHQQRQQQEQMQPPPTHWPM